MLINNAGILRDISFQKMKDDDWNLIFKVHVFGAYKCSRAAWNIMREQGYGRIINTSSVSGIYGNVGQTNYGAAKAGIAAFTTIASLELGRYGVTVNAVAPVALTRMTENLGPAPETEAEREHRSPKWIAPIVTWLASAESAGITGRVFEASGDVLAIAEGWHRGPTSKPVEDPTKLGPIVEEMMAKARLNAGMDGRDGTWPQPQKK